jgi:hypothetical protein
VPAPGVFETAEAAQARPGPAVAEGVREADVAEIVFRHTPKRSAVLYYCGVCVQTSSAETCRLTAVQDFSRRGGRQLRRCLATGQPRDYQVGAASRVYPSLRKCRRRPLLPADDKIGKVEQRYNEGAAAILAATLLTGGVLAYLPTRCAVVPLEQSMAAPLSISNRRISTITIIPRFPRPEAPEHRVAWYHYADCVLHSHADFIALPLPAFRKGRRIPFAALRLGQPFTTRPRSTTAAPKPPGSLRDRLLASLFKPDTRFASLRVRTDVVDIPFTHYTLEKPHATLSGTTECEDAQVLERALEFNAAAEEEWKRRQSIAERTRALK